MKILVIQQKMIGDVLASTIICQHLKENISGAQVHYVINSHTEAVVTNNPFVDRIILFTEEYRESKFAFYRFLKGIRNENYEAVIDVYGKLESNLISLFSKAKIKVSYSKWYTKFIYTHVFEYSQNPETEVGLAIENRLLLLSPIIPKENVLQMARPPKIYLTEKEIHEAKVFLRDNGLDLDKPLIMIGILGSGTEKNYPLPYMSQVIDEVAKSKNASLLFNYIPSQIKEAKEIYNLCAEETKKHIKFDIYADSLRGFLAILYGCDALVSNEGGAVNMAKALGVPTFSIYSPWVTKLSWNTYKKHGDHVAVHLAEFLPDSIKGKSREELKKQTPELYKLFKPSFFVDSLKSFLKSKIFSDQ